jgi:hypothetical protein
MTTRKTSSGSAAQAGNTPEPHVRRPKPQAAGPRRSASGDESVSEATARAVQVGYAVIADNIRQARDAAEKFRKGDYNIRDVPGDLDQMSGRTQHLIREFSTAGIDIFQWLLKAADPSGALTAGSLNLTVSFQGAAEATALTHTLTSPKHATKASEIWATPLQQGTEGSKPIAAPKFTTDLSGLVAVVTIPASQPPGVYSGLVYAKDEDIPLGVLSIEIAK